MESVATTPRPASRTVALSDLVGGQQPAMANGGEGRQSTSDQIEEKKARAGRKGAMG